MGDTRAIKHCRHQIDDVMELLTPSTGVGYAGWPVHDEAVAGAAEVRGHLLGPLARGIERQRPSHRGDGIRSGVADLIDHGEHGLGVVDDTVAEPVLDCGAFNAAFPGGPVVVEKIDEQRVLQCVEFLERGDKSSDLVVGVLGETGEGFHEPAASVRWVSDNSSQCGTPPAHGASSASGGTTPSRFCCSSVRSRCWCQPWSNRPAYLSRHSRATCNGA